MKIGVYNVGKHGLALHASDGTLAWTTGTDVSGYSTPVPLDDNGRQLLVLMGYRTFAAVEPLTGSVMWEYPWVNGLPGNIADPVVDGNQLFVSSGYNKGSALLRASGSQVAQVWLQRTMQTCYNTAVLWHGELYGPNESGSNLTCVEFSTGNVIWKPSGLRPCLCYPGGWQADRPEREGRAEHCQGVA
jgi:outer membrane protein assembly factor BamB